MNLLDHFKKTIAPYGMLNTEQKVLVAVSGGVDSVVLTHLCNAAGLHFCIAHCNFCLRGEESKRDEVFVKSMGKKYNVEVFVKQFDTSKYAEENQISIQEAARKLRYQFFGELKKENHFSFTLLAHNANDQIETLLINFFRGTGLTGLTGMPVLNKDSANALRPLLQVPREQIGAYAKENHLEWVEDSSNQSIKYTRNFLRNEIIPQLKNVFPTVQSNLLHNLERFQSINSLYQQMVSDLKNKILEIKESEVQIPILKLLRYENNALIYEVIKDYGFNEHQVPEVLKLANAESGKYIENNEYRMIKNRRWFVIVPKASTTSEIISIDEDVDEIKYSAGALEFKKVPIEKFILKKGNTIAQLNLKKIEWPLTLRKWRQGDYFYPLGMQKKKKLSRFFIDQKLSKTAKENVWVIESNKKIVWIVGQRIDDRFKVTDNTKVVLQINSSNL